VPRKAAGGKDTSRPVKLSAAVNGLGRLDPRHGAAPILGSGSVGTGPYRQQTFPASTVSMHRSGSWRCSLYGHPAKIAALRLPNLSSDQHSVRTRKVLQLKGLPEARFETLSAGNGTLERCECCGQVIATTDIEYELQFRQANQIATIRLHRECWELWRED
jgi:hypothetical protein